MTHIARRPGAGPIDPVPDSLPWGPVPPGLVALLSRASVSALQEPAPAGRALALILEAGLRAPDHGHLRPWRFVLIRGEARFRLAALATEALLRREPDAPEPLLERQRAKLLSTPLIIALGAQIRPRHKIPEIEQVLSLGAAAMNLLNAIHMLGFGGIWVTGANAYDPRLGAALGFEPPDRLIGFLLVGTPVPQEMPRAARRAALTGHVVEWTGSPAGEAAGRAPA